jgi:GDP-4-dehydro-6-deoxy-D-mannose reductase
MRALITGAAGFVGTHLCAYLLAHTTWAQTGAVYPGPAAPSADPRLTFVHADLRDPAAVCALVEAALPDFVFHLAAQAAIPASFSDPWETLETNIRGQLNLLEALRALRPAARVLVVGSSEEYGAPAPGELPQTEERPLRPGTPYAVSKVAQDLLGLQYFLSYRMPIVRVRPFNHTGPGQSERFVAPAFAAQIARIEAGLQEPVLRVGNLEAVRDLSDVRDIVRGYHLALTQGVPGEVYNLASGRPVAMRELLDMLLARARVPIGVEPDPARVRPLDVPVSFGSAAKLERQTGWAPAIALEQTVQDTLATWRAQVGAQGS